MISQVTHMVVPPLRALGLTLLSVVTGPGARRDPEARVQEGMNFHPRAPGKKRLSPKQVPPTSNLLAHLLLAPRIPIHLLEETQSAHKDPGPPRILVVTEALEEVGIPEATTDIRKIGEESSPHLGKGAAVAVTAELNLTQDTATTVSAPLTVEEDKEQFLGGS